MVCDEKQGHWMVLTTWKFSQQVIILNFVKQPKLHKFDDFKLGSNFRKEAVRLSCLVYTTMETIVTVIVIPAYPPKC